MKITRRQLRLIIENELIKESALASAILSMPAIIGGIGKIMEKAGKKFHKEKMELRGEKIEHFAHKLHETYRKPIKFLIQKSTIRKELTEDQLEKYTDIFFGILIAAMLYSTGVNIAKEVKHLKHHFELAALGVTLLETGLGAIEMGEEAHLISKLKNKDHQEKLAHAINDHVEKEGIHH
jgi:hypothetical protein